MWANPTHKARRTAYTPRQHQPLGDIREKLSLKDSLQESNFDKYLVISSLYLKVEVFEHTFKNLFLFCRIC